MAEGPAAARDELASLVNTMQRVLGREHPDTLTTRSELAELIGVDMAMLLLPGSTTQFAALLPVMERVLGREHPDTLTARSELARWTGEAGDPIGARNQFAALLPLRVRLLGPDHPRTLAVGSSLAYWTGRAGDPAGARELCFQRCRPLMSAGRASSTRGRSTCAPTSQPGSGRPGMRVQRTTSTPSCCRCMSGFLAAITRIRWRSGGASRSGASTLGAAAGGGAAEVS